nr:S-layer homology domain-containing protein [Paenibacillus phyllosphaerae]
MLANAQQTKVEVSSSPIFSDDIPLWAATAVEAVVREHWMTGYPDGTFRPNALITREEMAAVIIRSINLVKPNTGITDYADHEQISAWARSYIATAAKAGLMRGKENHRFAPKEMTTRAEAVSVIIATLRKSLANE